VHRYSWVPQMSTKKTVNHHDDSRFVRGEREARRIVGNKKGSHRGDRMSEEWVCVGQGGDAAEGEKKATKRNG
jgi:hypothetical protein